MLTNYGELDQGEHIIDGKRIVVGENGWTETPIEQSTEPDWPGFAAALNGDTVALRLMTYAPGPFAMILAQLQSFHHPATLLAAFNAGRTMMPLGLTFGTTDIERINGLLSQYHIGIEVT